MTKLPYILCAVATLALLASCSREAVVSADEEQRLDVAGNDIPGALDPGAYLVGFSACVEPLPKVSAGFGEETVTLSFQDGDEVLVFAPDVPGEKEGIYVYNGEKGVFEPRTTDDAVKLGNRSASVYYPASEFSVEEGRIVFTMPGAVASGDELGSRLPLAGMIPAVEREDTDRAVATFRNPGAVVRFRLNSVAPEGETVTAVRLSGSGVNISGRATLSWEGEGSDALPVLTTPDGDPEISLEGSWHLSSDSYREFFFLLPQSGTFSGMTLTVSYGKTEAAAAGLSETLSRDEALELSRGIVYSVTKPLKGTFSGGDGSVDYPYVISTAEDFKAISQIGLLSACYRQSADIDFDGADISASTIGSSAQPFSGSYDGGGFALRNFSVSGTPATAEEGVALFRAVRSGVLENITLYKAALSGGKFTAGLAGYVSGSESAIRSCSVLNSTVKGSADYGASGLVGGIYGGRIESCTATEVTIGNSSSASRSNFGGLVNYVNGTVAIDGCIINGTITSEGTIGSNFGGVVGQINNDNTVVTRCVNNAIITANGTSAVGGIVGLKSKGSVSLCKNYGSVYAGDNVGGIVGHNVSGDIGSSMSSGIIVASGDQAGGICGKLTGAAIHTCFSKGSVTARTHVGGIVGQADAESASLVIINSLSAASVRATGTGNVEAGGVAGRLVNLGSKYAMIYNCAGLNTLVESTDAAALRVGSLLGLIYSKKEGNTAGDAARARMYNCYSALDPAGFRVANTEATADIGGLVATIYSNNDIRNGYYLVDDGKVTGKAQSRVKNLTRTSAAVMTGEEMLEAVTSNQGTINDLFVNILTACTYTDETQESRYIALNSHTMCDWTLTGAEGEPLTHPVPAALVALGTEFYQ